MLRKVGLVLAVVGGVAAAVGYFGRGSEAATGPAQIRITNKEISFQRVDAGRRGRSAGDMEVTRQLLYNKRITPRPIGQAQFVCVFTQPPSRTCNGTIFLPRGRIVVGGALQVRHIYELAILGGTGLYDNARGTLTVTRYRRKPRSEILLFRLTG